MNWLQRLVCWLFRIKIIYYSDLDHVGGFRVEKVYTKVGHHVPFRDANEVSYWYEVDYYGRRITLDYATEKNWKVGDWLVFKAKNTSEGLTKPEDGV